MNIYKTANVSYYEPDDRYTFTPPSSVLFIDRDIHAYWNLCFDLTISNGTGFFGLRLGDEKYGLYITVYHFAGGTSKLEVCFNDHMIQTIDVPAITMGVAQEYDFKFAKEHLFLFLDNVQVLALDVGNTFDTDFEAGYIQIDTESAESTYTLEGMVYNPSFVIDQDTTINGVVEADEYVGVTWAMIDDKPTIPAAQVQSDWQQADPQSVSYIKRN